MPTTAHFGTWISPITAEQLVEQVVSLSYPSVSGDHLYWVEGRPSQKGRQTIMRRDWNGAVVEVLSDRFAARTLVHEYGGLPYVVHGTTVFFTNLGDQRLYRTSVGNEPNPITPEPDSPGAFRYAAPIVTPDGRFVICVRERHLEHGVLNDLVAIQSDGGTEPQVVAQGHDFYSAPTISPDGHRLAWTTWDHPAMPWDATTLWEAEIDAHANVATVRQIAGGDEESITQPRYSNDGRLHYISDRSGWWNLYRDDDGTGEPCAPMQAEFASPDWVLGLSSYCFVGSRLVATWSSDGKAHLGTYDEASRTFSEIDTPHRYFSGLEPSTRGVVAVVGSPTDSSAIAEIDLENRNSQVCVTSRPSIIAAQYLSIPRPVEFPTEGGLAAHGLFYPPKNADFIGIEGERPPLIVSSHGGPTSSALPTLNYQIQFWTSRGFAVVDVDYGGSSGYGRAYRDRLKGNWGVVDVDDCVNAARYLAANGEVDENRLLIHGGSAGGYTTLCAVTFRDVFAAGASYYGVADAGALARDTHKFESHYLDQLIGPWPEAEALYEERSPVFHAEKLSTPLILFQGLEDKVVPPNQAEMMFEVLRAKGVPVAYIAFPDEQHGFRQAENIKRTALAELYFYGKVLGFVPADTIEPVLIENL